MAYGYIDLYHHMDINDSKKFNYRFLVKIIVMLKISKKFYKYNVHLYI